MFVQAFDEVINGALAEFVRLSGEIGGNVKVQVMYLNKLACQIFTPELPNPWTRMLSETSSAMK